MDNNDVCIRCGKTTPYGAGVPITSRRYYIEGSGQLCEKCWREVYGDDATSNIKTRFSCADSPRRPRTTEQAGK